MPRAPVGRRADNAAHQSAPHQRIELPAHDAVRRLERLHDFGLARAGTREEEQCRNLRHAMQPIVAQTTGQRGHKPKKVHTLIMDPLLHSRNV